MEVPLLLEILQKYYWLGKASYHLTDNNQVVITPNTCLSSFFFTISWNLNLYYSKAATNSISFPIVLYSSVSSLSISRLNFHFLCELVNKEYTVYGKLYLSPSLVVLFISLIVRTLSWWIKLKKTTGCPFEFVVQES